MSRRSSIYAQIQRKFKQRKINIKYNYESNPCFMAFIKEAADISQPKTTGRKSAPNTKIKISADDPIVYRCTKCGKRKGDPKGFFFMSKTSPMYTGNEMYAHICSDCVNELFDADVAKYKDTKLATIIACHNIDMYFSEELYESIKDNANFSFGGYLRLMNGSQYKAKNFTTFLTSLVRDGSTLKGATEIQRDKETTWKAADLKNKNYVLQSVGYDCFEDESYTDAHRKFLFNTLADYLTDDVLEDPHVLQSVIGIVKSLMQVEEFNKLINAETRKAQPDVGLVKELTGIKTKLSSDITKTASENGITVKGSQKGGRGASSLTAIMKEMGENGFEEIKVNVIDARLSESFKEVAEQNARALINELNFTSDEYAKMLADQSVIVSDLQEKTLLLEEEIRKLKIENKRLSADRGEE